MKYLDYNGLKTYDQKIKGKINERVSNNDPRLTNSRPASGGYADSLADYCDPNQRIKVGFSDDGVTTTSYFAVYTGRNINDMSIPAVKDVLGIANVVKVKSFQNGILELE